MTGISRGDIDALVGNVDDIIVTEMIGTGASAAELAEAVALLDARTPPLSAGNAQPTRRVRRLIDLLMAVGIPASPTPVLRTKVS